MYHDMPQLNCLEGFQKDYYDKFIRLPAIIFHGHHPDGFILNKHEITTPISRHSLIIFLSHKFGISQPDCYQLFNPNIYNQLGYFDFYKTEVERLKANIASYGLNEKMVDDWLSHGSIMHTDNHPKLFVLESLLKALFLHRNISFAEGLTASDFLMDDLQQSVVAPPIISSNGYLQGKEIYFKSGLKTGRIYSLKEFIELSYKLYDDNKEHLDSTKISSLDLGTIKKQFLSFLENKVLSSHPYKSKADYCFWKKSISNVDIKDVDPVLTGKINISKGDLVATAGSCFAQHIAKRLRENGFNYFIAEQPPEKSSTSDSDDIRSYYDFSCRFGNIYTTRQLTQLFDRAFNKYEPKIEPWLNKNQEYIDPIRPNITKKGFSTPQYLEDDRENHLKAVRYMFEKMDTLIFTLGLTECWEFGENGLILPMAPGVLGGCFDNQKYNFINLTFHDVVSDLNYFIESLQKVNPNAKIILTVSPVPLMATYENRHVLVSTIASKSILRSAAEEICNKFEHVNYFPSYEIITGNYNNGIYFENDKREVTASGVDHVMKLFFKHCTSSVRCDFSTSELKLGYDVICDEENIDI